jgi:hypothetical protein
VVAAGVAVMVAVGVAVVVAAGVAVMVAVAVATPGVNTMTVRVGPDAVLPAASVTITSPVYVPGFAIVWENPCRVDVKPSLIVHR